MRRFDPFEQLCEVDDYISPLTSETYTENRMRTLLDHYEHQAPFLAATLRIIEMANIAIMASGTMLASLDLEVPPYPTTPATDPQAHARLPPPSGVVGAGLFPRWRSNQLEGSSTRLAGHRPRTGPQTSAAACYSGLADVCAVVSLCRSFDGFFLSQFRLSTRLVAVNSAIRELRALQTGHDSLSTVIRRSRSVRSNLVVTTENAVMQCEIARTGVQPIANESSGSSHHGSSKH